MQKLEMATRIAVALFPQEFWIDSPAVQGEIENQMKQTKKELEALMSLCENVEAQRV
jgi:hypothetical protein